MSAFMVSDGCMDRVISAINITHEFLPIDPGETSSVHTPETVFGRKLFDLNAKAVDSRYGEGEAATFREPWGNYTHTPVPITPVEGYKALECLLYQLSEGDVPAHMLYQELEQHLSAIAERIIHDLAAYAEAPWS